MATTNGSSPPGPLFPSRDHEPSNPPDILQSNDGVDRVSHREANGAGESSYSSMRVDGSAVPSEPPLSSPQPPPWGTGGLYEHRPLTPPVRWVRWGLPLDDFPVTRHDAVIPDPMNSSPSTQPSKQPWAGTNPLASSMQRVTNVSTPAEPPQRQEQVRVDLLRNADSNGSESQNVNLPSRAQTSSGHQAHLPHLPKDPTGEKATYSTNVDLLLRANSNKQPSGLTQDTAPGESQAPLERTPHEVPAYPNASRECAPPDKKGGHDPLNRKRAPNDVSSPLVRRLSATDPPPRCQSSPKPPSMTTRAHYVPYSRPQTTQ